MPTTNDHHHATINHHSPPKQNPNKLLSIFLKLIIMFLLLSIFLIFIGLAAIVLLNLVIAGSVVNRRRHRHTADIPTNLPMFRYTAETTSDDCSICLDGFKEGESCRVLNCDHLFHAKCVDPWLMKVLNCPVCRAPVRVDGDRVCGLGGCGDDESKFLWVVGVGREVVW